MTDLKFFYSSKPSSYYVCLQFRYNIYVGKLLQYIILYINTRDEPDALSYIHVENILYLNSRLFSAAVLLFIQTLTYKSLISHATLFRHYILLDIFFDFSPSSYTFANLFITNTNGRSGKKSRKNTTWYILRVVNIGNHPPGEKPTPHSVERVCVHPSV